MRRRIRNHGNEEFGGEKAIVLRKFEDTKNHAGAWFEGAIRAGGQPLGSRDRDVQFQSVLQAKALVKNCRKKYIHGVALMLSLC